MTDRVSAGNLRVARVLYDFVNNEALPGTDIDPDSFWAGVDKVVTDLTPKNQDLLRRRDELQAQIDKWHRQRVIEPLDAEAYRQFLTEIGYLQPEPADFTITTSGVDDEITTTAGPQLVVPVLNARFALNAANARWGSLYDALYGTDVIPESDGAEQGHRLQQGPRRQGDRLRPQVPRRGGAAGVGLVGRCDRLEHRRRPTADRSVGEQSTGLASPEKFVGYSGELGSPSWSVLLVNHGLHIEILVDPESPIGKTDRAGIKDVVLESAITTIMDFEDSVAAVDADDKVLGYRNWLGLNKGDLAEEVDKGGKTLHPRAQRGPHLHHPGRRGADPARTQPAVRPQRRPPDDQRRDRRRRRQRGVRGHPGRAVHRSDRNPRAQDRRRQRPTGEQPHRLHLHRQAQDARPRRGGIHLRAVQPRRRRAGTAAGHPEGRHHGRGAPHHAQPQGLHQGRRRPGGVHQHRLPGPHRRRDPHLDGGRPDGPQGCDEEPAVDPGLRGRTTSTPGLPPGSPARPRSARACGP